MTKKTLKHGTIGMYRHRHCRCDDCRIVWNKKTLEWKSSAREMKKVKAKYGPILKKYAKMLA